MQEKPKEKGGATEDVSDNMCQLSRVVDKYQQPETGLGAGREWVNHPCLSS
jgi:hypothetical protein